MMLRVLQSRHFVSCLLAAVTGMALYFEAPFPEQNLFLGLVAARSAQAFLFLKYTYFLFLYTSPLIFFSVALSGMYIVAIKT